MVIAVGAVGLSSALNHEVSKRLATVPPSSTSPTTTILAPTTTQAPARVVGSRITRPPAPTVSTTSSTTIPVTPTEFQAETPSELIVALEKLPVDDEHADGYSRSQFGFFKDADGDHCGSRKEVMLAEALDVAYNTYNCNIQSGRWFSPFDAAKLDAPDKVLVTHLVALREAWESGAWMWDGPARNAYLNDLDNDDTMLVVSPASDEARNDADPGGWLPSNTAYRCDYLRSWVHVKALYKLSVDPGEREAIAAAALHC